MGQPARTSKGEIKITNADGRIRLRWRWNGERYSLNLPYAYNTDNLHFATIKVAEIKLDIMKGSFDTSLEKYKPVTVNKPALHIRESKIQTVVDSFPIKITLMGELVERFNDWTKNIRNIDIQNSFDYLYTRKLLSKWGGLSFLTITEMLGKENWADTTYNRRVNYLRSFFAWLLDCGIVDQNPLLHVSKRRGNKRKKLERRKPLNEEEIYVFLEAIRNDTFCSSASGFKHSFYYPFLKFIFITGVRNAEAIGLRVKHVNVLEGHIEISETFARTTKGTNHAARISKGTKTENVRYIPLNEELSLLLLSRLHDDPNSFIFPSPKGMSINDQMLQKRILKPVMRRLGLAERDLYAARHSFGTRAAQQGIPITDIAYLMGHSTVETTMRNYVSVDKKAILLPRMK